MSKRPRAVHANERTQYLACSRNGQKNVIDGRNDEKRRGDAERKEGKRKRERARAGFEQAVGEGESI